MAATVRTECAVCGGDLDIFLSLGSSPLADRFPVEPGGEGAAYPLRAASCKDCGLAQLMDVVDDGELFSQDYGFRTAGSPALVPYYQSWARWAVQNFGGTQARKLTVDIGCNDGTLLRNFQRAGHMCVGVDPSGAAQEATGRGIEVYTEPFSEDCARELREEEGPAGLITGINVAAHVRDPLDFLRGIEHLLSEDGVAILEFQDLERLVAGCQIDHVYHEHRFFYSSRSCGQLAKKAGLRPVRTILTDGQGGSVRMALVRGAAQNWPEIWRPFLDEPNALRSLQARAEFMKKELLAELARADQRGAVAGYGATAKSATLLNWCGITKTWLNYIEDATPSKAGRLTPGTHIPIVMAGERERPATFLLLAWNYLGAIVRREQEFLKAGGKFIVPAPVPFVV